jgi:vancomycin resistance protein YoaR
MHVRRFTVVLLAALGGLVAVIVLASVVEHWVYTGKVLPGVEVAGANVDGKKNVAAYDAIARLATDLDRTPIKVRAGENQYTIDPSLVGFDVDVDATARLAEREGRDGNPIAVLTSTVMRRVRPDRVPLAVRYDPARLEGLLDGWANGVDRGIVEGGLRFDGTNVVEISPRTGIGLQRDEARGLMLAALRTPDRSREIVLPVGAVHPHVEQAEVDAAAARARELLASSVTINAGTRQVVVTPASLAVLLGTKLNGNQLDLMIDTNKLRFVLGARFSGIEQPSVDATFAITAANTVSVVPSKDGREIDLDAVAASILRGDRFVTATVRIAHPAHDTAWAQNLGIKRQVSTFTTYHPAGQPRVTNIHIAADVLNNTVVEPGKTFSLNDTLGPRTPQKGYVKAPILVEDGFGEDYGGGVSQLTTTLYNAVFFGGYEDVSHSPHLFYISRYPMGREATINYPSVDLKFRDDTRHGVLIRTSYTPTSITVTFYGDNDGRTVREENRKILHTETVTEQLIPCPAPHPEDDPNHVCDTLAAGAHETVGTGETGYDVAFDRVIDQPGQPEQRTSYHVHYPMLPIKILVGAAPPASSSTSTSTPASVRPPQSSTTTKTTVRHP